MLCIVLAGCGFHSSANPIDGSPLDPVDAPATDAPLIDASAIDAVADAMVPPATCWQHWLDQDVALDSVGPLTPLSTSGTERDPWISEDGLRLYFWRQGATGGADGYLSIRNAPSDPFLTANKLDGVSLADRDEGRMAFTRDELVIVVSANFGGGSPFDIRTATRANRSASFTTPVPDHLAAVNTANTQHFDPFLSGDGQHLYLAPVPNGAPQHIAMASRTALNADFTPAALVRVINTTEPLAGDSDPALSPDERVIVFSSNRSGGVGSGDLYYATRMNAAQPFGAPLPIPTVNSTFADGDPMLSADGCTLYFASLRAGSFDLYTAAVIR
ncbi:MAG: hypothetical protein ABIY55_10420 [Kofleriaceae bacterium]